MAVIGEGYFGKVSFVDGETPTYSRPYLVVEVCNEGVYVVNISSSQGKEHKLLFKTNYSLSKYNPPFLKPSFVKLDSKMFVSNSDLNNMRRLSSGRTLNKDDMDIILDSLQNNGFSSSH